MQIDQATLYIIAASAVLAFFVVVILLVQTPCRVAWQPTNLQLGLYDTATVQVSFQRRAWALGRWHDVPATFLIRSDTNPIFSVVAVKGSLFEGTESFVLNVTATKTGTETIRISVTPPWHSQAYLSEMPIEVVAREGEVGS